MLKTKKIILDKGYKIVKENELGVSFVKEDIKTCVILLENYDEEQLYSNSELRESLEKKYNFASKGTFCVFINFNGNLEDIERDTFDAIKISSDKVDILPHNKNKDIILTFKPMTSINDTDCDYVINPYEEFDGMFSINFYRFLATVKSDCIIKYPKIITGMYLSWFRYITDKYFTVKLIK